MNTLHDWHGETQLAQLKGLCLFSQQANSSQIQMSNITTRTVSGKPNRRWQVGGKKPEEVCSAINASDYNYGDAQTM